MSLTRKDASLIMGMLARGDKNHDIAAWFGENPARIAEVKDGTAFGVVPAAAMVDLPPKGAVGLKGRRLRAYVQEAVNELRSEGPNALEKAIKELEEGLKRFDAHES